MARSSHQSMQRYPLTAILGSDAGVGLLRELARHGGQLSAPDLTRRSGFAKASVARGLSALVQARVVEVTGSGRSLLYRLHPDHPLAPELAALFGKEEARFTAILDAIRSAATAAGPGVVAVWLYGSVARGEDTPSSDLDVAVAAVPERLQHIADTIRDRLAGAGQLLGFTPSITALDTGDAARLAGEHDPWWTTMATDAIALVGEHPVAVAARVSNRRPAAAA